MTATGGRAPQRGLKPCMFFNTPRGCKNGARCTFAHDETYIPTQEDLELISRKAPGSLQHVQGAGQLPPGMGYPGPGPQRGGFMPQTAPQYGAAHGDDLSEPLDVGGAGGGMPSQYYQQQQQGGMPYMQDGSSAYSQGPGVRSVLPPQEALFAGSRAPTQAGLKRGR